MEEYTQITLEQWMQWKEDIRQKLTATAGNFVYIGYRLKQIRDSGMFGGAADVFEFAQREYGLEKSMVSRFIAINEKYSEGGNSLELKSEFRNFSSSKLSEMLTLSDSEIQLITEKTTVREIRELKGFSRQEVGELGEETQEVGMWTPLEKCLIDFFSTRKDRLNGIMKCMDADPPEYQEAAEVMNPSGQSSHKKGIVFLFLYDWNTGVKYKLLTQKEPVSLTWQELLNNVFHIYGECIQPDVWKEFYESESEGNISGNGQKEKTVTHQSDQGLEAPVATSQQIENVEETEEEKEHETVDGKFETESKAEDKSEKDTEESITVDECMVKSGTSGGAQQSRSDGRDNNTGSGESESSGTGDQEAADKKELTEDDSESQYDDQIRKYRVETSRKAGEVYERLQGEEIEDAVYYRKVRDNVKILDTMLKQMTEYIEKKEEWERGRYGE